MVNPLQNLLNVAYGPGYIPPARDAALEGLRASDAAIRNKIKQAATRDGEVTVNAVYRTGPDGKPYAVDANITAGRRVVPDALEQDAPRQQPQNFTQKSLAPSARNFSELLPPQLLLSPTDQVKLFGVDGANGAGFSAKNFGKNTPPEGAQLVFVLGPDGKYFTVAGGLDDASGNEQNPIRAARQAADAAGVARAQGEGGAESASRRVASVYDFNTQYPIFDQKKAIDLAA